MSVPAYPEYKESGVAWLGKVPSHWKLSRFKNLLKERDARSVDGSEELLSVSAYTGITPKSESTGDGEFLSRAESLEGYKLCKHNDLVMNIMLAWNRGLGVTKFDGIVSPAYCVFEVGDHLHPDFCNYAVRADEYIGYFKAHSSGVIDSRLRLYPDKFGALTCAYPPLAEQAAIVAFLDRETAKIDALVTEQERLIALLKEKRQTVISDAVTKSLNPNVPIKDSGIEWLGEIPAHWDRVQLGRLCSQVSDGPHFSPPYIDEGYMFLSARNIRVDGWSLGDAKYIAQGLYDELCKRIVPERGDVLYTKGGTTGVARVVDFDTPFQVWVHVAVLKIIRELSLPEYVAYALNSSGCYEQSQLHTRGATNQDLGLTRMIKIWLALPPIAEQQSIVRQLNAQLRGIDAASNEALRSVALLQERRAALISAAVTGKSDVHGSVTGGNVIPISRTREQQNWPSLRAVVGAYTIRELGPLGRMAVMKAGYLAEAQAGLSGLNGRYERNAAGPYDPSLIAAMERGAGELCSIQTIEPQAAGMAVIYAVPSGFQAPAEPLEALTSADQAKAFLSMLTLLKGIGRDGVEAVATIYAVWNDLIAAGKTADDEAVCSGVLNDWHDEKREKFKRTDLDHWLAWMRRNSFGPDGTAPRTDHQGSLFA